MNTSELVQRMRDAEKAHYADPFSLTTNFRLSQLASEAADALEREARRADELQKDFEHCRKVRDQYSDNAHCEWLRANALQSRLDAIVAKAKEDYADLPLYVEGSLMALILDGEKP